MHAESATASSPKAAAATQAPCSSTPKKPVSLTTVEDTKSVAGPLRLVREALQNKKIHVNSDQRTLDFERAKVTRVASDGHRYQYVTIPLTSAAYNPLSNVAVVLDHNGRVVTYAESVYATGAQGNIQLTSYQDGKATRVLDTGVRAMSNDSFRKEMTRTRHAIEAHGDHVTTHGWGEKVACLGTTLGVSGVVARIILTACAGACATSESGVTIPVCAACIAGYATVGGASITAVASCFNK